MPQRIETVNEFQQYLSGVMKKAAHHAKTLESLLPALAGAVVFFKDPGTRIAARTYRGETANVLFVMMGGRRFALRYDHQTRSVQVRQGTVRGPVEATFDGNTSPDQILSRFRRLGAPASAARHFRIAQRIDAVVGQGGPASDYSGPRLAL